MEDIEIPCKECQHTKKNHNQYTYYEKGFFERHCFTEWICVGAGIRWLSGKSKCRCWIYVPLDNLSYIEQIAKRKNLI